MMNITTARRPTAWDIQADGWNTRHPVGTPVIVTVDAFEFVAVPPARHWCWVAEC